METSANLIIVAPIESIDLPCCSKSKHKYYAVILQFILLPILQAKSKQLQKEGWEYSTVFTTRFHATNRKMDLVRRRRWHRKMTQIVPSAPAVFHISSSEVS
jgi:hypothetical protein